MGTNKGEAVQPISKEAFVEGGLEGIYRCGRSIWKDLGHRRGADRMDMWNNSIPGAIAERAVHLYYDEEWDEGGTDRVDIGEEYDLGYHIRSIQRKGNRLPVYKDEPLAEPYILVSLERLVSRGKPQEALLCGWIFGAEARQKQYLDNPCGHEAYYVDREDLHPMSALPPPGRPNVADMNPEQRDAVTTDTAEYILRTNSRQDLYRRIQAVAEGIKKKPVDAKQATIRYVSKAIEELASRPKGASEEGTTKPAKT